MKYKSRKSITYDDDNSHDEANVEEIFENDGEEDIFRDLKPNTNFLAYQSYFNHLTKHQNVKTQYPIVSCMITYDSTRSITVSKKDDREFWVRQYDLDTYEKTFEEQIGGQPNCYIKLKEVEQNGRGDKYAITYLDDGKFRLRVFGKESRDPAVIQEEEFNVNKALGIDEFTMPNEGFQDPYISCSFITDDKLFVQLFYNADLSHYHFIYDHSKREIEGEYFSCQLKCTLKNFPYKSFYNSEDHEIYSFYRQGQAFRINANLALDTKIENMIDADLGQMYLFQNKALIVRSSSSILFFKILNDEKEGTSEWTQYNCINKRGFIFYIKGNKRIQITTNEKIYFYLIDPDTYEPILENVMYNFMDCNQMMFGSKVKYGITYKQNQKSFDVWSRKYSHNFQVPVLEKNLEGSFGADLPSMNAFCVAEFDKIEIYDSNSFQNIGTLDVNLFEAQGREPNQLLQMTVCQGEKFIACISGKNLIRKIQKPNQLFVFKRVEAQQAGQCDEFVQHRRIILRDHEIMNNICMVYYFKNPDKDGVIDTLIFVKYDRILQLNFETEVITSLYVLQNPLIRQPEFFTMNDTQDILIIASQQEGIYLNISKTHQLKSRMLSLFHNASNNKGLSSDKVKKEEISEEDSEDQDEKDDKVHDLSSPLQSKPTARDDEEKKEPVIGSMKNGDQPEVDLDQFFNIGLMKEIIHDEEDKVFYILANKYDDKLGFFLLRMNDSDPSDFKFLTKWKNKLDLGDADLFVLRDNEIGYKELVISYKTIYINTYNIMIYDISSSEINQALIFRYEGFQLWESEIRGFVLEKNRDFVTVSRDGIKLIALGSHQKRLIVDSNNRQQIIHPLESVNFLKVDKMNYIVFQFSDEIKTISVQQEFSKVDQKQGEQTDFETVYNIKLWEPTLRELLIIQSLYLCQTQTKIVELVEDQALPHLFFKSFLEFDCANVASLLSFDSRSMESLLNERHAAVFDENYPIFYKNKFPKMDTNIEGNQFFYRTAIDTALRKNQIKAVDHMINYIIVYQNNIVSSFLFNKELPMLLDKGVAISHLFKSNIFRYPIEFDNWPSIHSDKKTYLKGFFDSIFTIRYNYDKIFPEIKDFDLESVDSDKIYKIAYKVNLLPLIGQYLDEDNEFTNSEVNLMGLINETEELDIFQAQSIQELIEFKWITFARKHHVFGCCMHFFYMLMLLIYINQVYIHFRPDLNVAELSILLIVGITYPVLYDWTQITKTGDAYFEDPWNYADMLFGWSSVTTVALQNFVGPNHVVSKSFMLIIIVLAVVKTFFFLRIFSALSPIVTMLINVIYDLRIFLLFYSILCCFFSLQIGILGVGDPYIPGKFKDLHGVDSGNFVNRPGSEFKDVGMFVGNIITVFSMSTGSYDFNTANLLDSRENVCYWVIWLMIIVMTNVVFLNFIIAEACASYESVSAELEAFILKERSALIQEAEEMTPSRLKKNDYYPKFLIIREMEE